MFSAYRLLAQALTAIQVGQLTALNRCQQGQLFFYSKLLKYQLFYLMSPPCICLLIQVYLFLQCFCIPYRVIHIYQYYLDIQTSLLSYYFSPKTGIWASLRTHMSISFYIRLDSIYITIVILLYYIASTLRQYL